MFWKFHPNQPVINIPFTSIGIYYRQGIQGMQINMKWVTYNDDKKTLYCSFCLMYALEKRQNTQMIQGCSERRHVTLRLLEHEKSHCHKLSTEVNFMDSSERFIRHSLLKEQLSLK
uniref:Uncharacterized protein n=1 Tax=Octopus bimaculoides TaxID=37653 RepID=A0A0L8GYY1_OCTBM